MLTRGGLSDELHGDINAIGGRDGDMRPGEQARIPRALFEEGDCVDALEAEGGIG